MNAMRVRRVGGSALLIECRDAEEVEAWRAELWRRRDELRCSDVVPGARTVLIDGVDPEVAARLATWEPATAVAPAHGATIEIPTTFDGADLPDVARRW